MSLGERVPKLRFPGFEGEWIPTVLKSILHERKTYAEKDGSYPHATLSKEGIYGKTDRYDRDFLVSTENKEYKITLKNDLCYNPANLKFGVICLNTFGSAIFSPIYVTFEIDKSYSPQFVGAALTQKDFIGYALRFQQGTVYERMAVSPEDFLSISRRFPAIAEQEKIAEFISLLNSRIAAQRKLVELLKKHKRGLIKRLFRPNEHTKWKSVRLGDVGTFHKGAPLSKADISEDGKPFILYGELYTTYGEIIKDVVRRTTAEIDIPYLSRCGDVIIPTSGETAEEIATASCIMSDGVVLGGDLNIYRSEHIDGRFLAYAVRFIISRDISRIAQGVSVVHISATELKRISVSIPSKDEQIRIISVLENYDNRILHSQEILKKMETTKDGLLQQLFV